METRLSAIFQRLPMENSQAPVKLGAGNGVLINQAVSSGRKTTHPARLELSALFITNGKSGYRSNLQTAHILHYDVSGGTLPQVQTVQETCGGSS